MTHQRDVVLLKERQRHILVLPVVVCHVVAAMLGGLLHAVRPVSVHQAELTRRTITERGVVLRVTQSPSRKQNQRQQNRPNDRKTDDKSSMSAC
jgi:hypothetical protein